MYYINSRCIKDERYCSICGSESTLNYYKIYDKNGNWDRKSWKCNKCNAKEWNDNFVKPARPYRTKGISKDSTLGKGIIGEAIVAKVLELEMCNKKANNFNYKFDLFKHDKYGNIQVKIASSYLNQWKFDF